MIPEISLNKGFNRVKRSSCLIGIENMSTKIYLVFFTFALSDPNTFDLYKDGLKKTGRRVLWSMIDRAIEYYQPPFSHVEIVFKHMTSPTILTSYTFTMNGFSKFTSEFRKPFHTFVSLRITKEQERILSGILSGIKIGNPFSYKKLFQIEGAWAHRLMCSPYPFPDLRKDSCMCAEFVAAILQKSGIIPVEFHPSYISSSELFRYLSSITQPVTRHPLGGTCENSHAAYLKLTGYKEIPKLDQSCLAVAVMSRISVSVSQVEVPGNTSEKEKQGARQNLSHSKYQR